jgi:hypothetical protein
MRALSLTIAALSIAACDSHAANVCADIGYCTAQSDDQVEQCKAQAKDLAAEARAGNCAAQYDAYFDCANDHYQCNGDTPAFPGCDPARVALNACFDVARASNACGELAARLAKCAAANSSPAVPTACAALGVCAAQCWLDSVADVCAPTPAELSAEARCAATCPL